MSSIDNYFNWYDLFVNQVSGSQPIFLFLSIIVIAFVCAKFRFPNIVSFTIFIIWCLILAATMNQIILPVILLVVGFFISWTISRLVRD